MKFLQAAQVPLAINRSDSLILASSMVECSLTMWYFIMSFFLPNVRALAPASEGKEIES